MIKILLATVFCVALNNYEHLSAYQSAVIIFLMAIYMAFDEVLREMRK